MLEVAPDILALLLAAAFFAGFVDAIAGGGGLITVPALLLAGGTPLQALSTNKVQGLFGAGTAALAYARGGHVDLRKQLLPATISFFAAFGGALLISVLPSQFIRLILPILLIAVALYFLLQKGLDDRDRAQRMSGGAFIWLMVPLIGAYDGFLGPGTGSFFMLAFVTLMGHGILRATAHTKLLNFASNTGGLAGFALVASPWWITGLCMGAAQIVGARIGAGLAQRLGSRLIKPLLVATSTAMALKLIWDLL
ncbi:MAG: TSUP family transporter [Planctomycetales bacterium]|nr:TSUP family transporter [Planctomycetales bacterium]NIP68308.1 TSUP family transporter [Planctomycetales bacterium]